MFCAKFVACGYSPIPRVNFTKNYVLVMNDVIWCILLVAMIVWGLDTIIVDVETAFLHGDLEEEIYMNLPYGMEGEGNKCLLLLKQGIVWASARSLTVVEEVCWYTQEH